MNHQPEKCCEKCVDGLVYPTSVCLIKDCKCHQPKPEAPNCGVKFGVFTCPFKKPCKEHPASTEMKCEHSWLENSNVCYHCGAPRITTSTSPASTEKCAYTGLPKLACGHCQHIERELSTPASTEEWEKEFDKHWLEANTLAGLEERHENIKSFIRSHDQQLRQRIVEEAEKIIQKERFAGAPAALNKLITFITNLK